MTPNFRKGEPIFILLESLQAITKKLSARTEVASSNRIGRGDPKYVWQVLSKAHRVLHALIKRLTFLLTFSAFLFIVFI